MLTHYQKFMLKNKARCYRETLVFFNILVGRFKDIGLIYLYDVDEC
jgi:hypothetical protein